MTGGQQMNEFVQKVTELLVAAGVDASHVYTRNAKDVPGFYRPAKEWDILIVSDRRLVAAIELKSQVGPSFGNNFNNRTEEALGSAVDLWTAYREGAFQTSPKPWLGYLFLLEDCPASRAPVSVRESHSPVLAEFRDASYAARYELLCRKLVRERQYDSACFLMTERGKARLIRNYTEPAEDLGASQFLDQLLHHVSKRSPL